jgi:hypothetical protein
MTKINWNKQYEYPASMRTSIEGKRHYEITGKKLPSVTTILSATQSAEKMASILKWQKRVGEVEAERVKNQAASRGTNMHLHLGAVYSRDRPQGPNRRGSGGRRHGSSDNRQGTM